MALRSSISWRAYLFPASLNFVKSYLFHCLFNSALRSSGHYSAEWNYYWWLISRRGLIWGTVQLERLKAIVQTFSQISRSQSIKVRPLDYGFRPSWLMFWNIPNNGTYPFLHLYIIKLKSYMYISRMYTEGWKYKSTISVDVSLWISYRQHKELVILRFP